MHYAPDTSPDEHRGARHSHRGALAVTGQSGLELDRLIRPTVQDDAAFPVSAESLTHSSSTPGPPESQSYGIRRELRATRRLSRCTLLSRAFYEQVARDKEKPRRSPGLFSCNNQQRSRLA